jgi:hypothetical protein
MSAYKSTFTTETRGALILMRDWGHETGAPAVRSEPQAVLLEMSKRNPRLRDFRLLVEEQSYPSNWYELEHLNGTFLQFGPISPEELATICPELSRAG